MASRFDSARMHVRDAQSSLTLLKTQLLERIRVTGGLTDEFVVTSNKILGSLRKALERCSRGLFEMYKPSDSKRRVSFPIVPLVPPNKKRTFAQWVNGDKIPGLSNHRPDLVALLESFQEYTNPASNGWLPELELLSDNDKHDDDDPRAAISRIKTVIGGGFAAMGRVPQPSESARGLVFMHNCSSDEGTIHKLVMYGNEIVEAKIDPGVSLIQAHEVVVRFDATNMGVIPFLDKATAGVDHIVEAIIQAI